MHKSDIYRILHAAYFSDRMHEKAVIDHLRELLDGASVFVDAGASLGQFTYYANQILEAGRIVAIEADPIRAERLQSNAATWATTRHNRIDCIAGALSDVSGAVRFYSTSSPISGGLFRNELAHLDPADRERVQWTEIRVASYTLDELFPDTPPDVVKMDVEGSELRVLKGSQRILSQRRTKFLIEVHNWRDPEGQANAAEVYDFMNARGYHAVDFHGKKLFSHGAITTTQVGAQSRAAAPA